MYRSESPQRSRKSKKSKHKKSKSKKHKKHKKHKKDKKKKKTKKKKKSSREEAKTGSNTLPSLPEAKIIVNDRLNIPILLAGNNYGMLEKTIRKSGHGRKPLKGQTVKLHGSGYLKTGKKRFWTTSGKYGKPYSFTVGIGKVVKGWDHGVLSMRVGEKAELHVSGNFGYGVTGNETWQIPPNAELIFEIEILHIGKYYSFMFDVCVRVCVCVCICV